MTLGANINSRYLDATPTLSADGLHLLFTYEQVSNAELQIASRPSRESPFGPRGRLDEIGLGSTLHSSSTADFVKAFDAGGYEQGARASFATVPEPTFTVSAVVCAIAIFMKRRERPSDRSR